MEASSTSTRSLTALACRFHESDDTADPDRLAEWIHEDAEMSLAMTHFKLVRGKRAIMDALYRERESVLYSARVERHEWLDETTLLVRGQVRYAVEGRGVTQATIWWIDEFSDGLLRRVRAFQSEVTARAAWADGRKSAGNGGG